jgi:DNA-binding transcriptional ArsR family regulator
MDAADMTGDQLLRVLATLANPHRLRVVAALAEQRNYVSQLARELGISRALLQVHLRKLQAAGLVSAVIEVSEDGKAMKFYEVTPFTIQLTPKEIMAAATTLTAGSEPESEVRDLPVGTAPFHQQEDTGRADHQRRVPAPVRNGRHRPGAHRPETRRDQHAACPAARPARPGAESPQGRRVNQSAESVARTARTESR